MWRAFVSLAVVSRAFGRLALVVTALAMPGCGPRNLDLIITIDAGACMLMVPAGGSVLYQVTANGAASDAGAGSFCGACLAVNSAISGPDALVAFLHAHAPACAGVHPGTTLGVRITGWSVAGCPPSVTAPTFCADTPTVLVPDGTSNATLMLMLGCKTQCASVCKPTTCAAQGKDCGAISDGCNMVLDCGMCHPPLSCGVTVPNVCGR
jgi:hypothetical protein